MKLVKLLMVPFVAMVMFSCSSSPSGEAAATGEATNTATATSEAKTFNADVSSSLINWEGTKLGGSHVGTLALASGSVSVKDGNIEAGNFVIDMNSMKCTDKDADEETKASLIGHLTTGDFFEVEKYPEAKFEIAEVKAIEGVEGMTHSITGNLTMKDKTLSVTFNANVGISENGVTAESNNFKINRTEWGIMYGSTLAGAVKEKAINDEIGLKIRLVAN